MTPEQQADVQLRLTVAVQFKEKSLEEIQKLYEWIKGKPQTILPVSKFEVVKP